MNKASTDPRQPKRTRKNSLWLLLLIYLALATAYSVVVPIGRGADEWAHYWYARFIADNGRLPQTIAEREAAGYKSDWPPLYHLLAAGLTFWVETDGPPIFKYRQDNIRYQLASAQGPEAILHTEDEQWPWQQEILIWHLGRFLSIAFSVGTLLVTYRVAAEVFAGGRGAGEPFDFAPQQVRDATQDKQGSRGETTFQNPKSRHRHASEIQNPKSLALLTTAVLAFNPRFLFTGMLFNYDSLTLLLSALFLLLAIRIAKGYHPRWGFVGLGVVVGLALVTKYLAAPLVLVVIVLAFWQAVGRRGARKQGSKEAGEQRSRGAGEQGRPSTSLRTGGGAGNSTNALRFTFHVSRFTLPFLFIITPWFTYLIRTFNEIDTYGPVLGALAPLIRGDGSDRTVEALFAWLSGGQAPAPAYIEQQSYSAWQIIAELPLTFWGNPIIRPYPLTWFIIVMTGLTLLAALGLVRVWRAARPEARRLLLLLILTCALPLPFMAIRLFGARDALEAMQGRHILFLAGPAFATLFVGGLSVVSGQWSFVANRFSYFTFHISRFTFYALPALLLTGAIAQLLFMQRSYPPLLPVRTTPLAMPLNSPPEPVTLPGGSTLLGYDLSAESGQALRVSLWWQAGDAYAPEDYQLELNLVDNEGQVQANWFGYQTQARYPTRAWEPGDIIRDEGWLPLLGLAPGAYEIRLRVIGQTGPATDWQPLTIYKVQQPVASNDSNRWQVWQNGKVVHRPEFRERETVQFTNYQLPITKYQITGPDGLTHNPTSTTGHIATVIIQPDWPAGEYTLDGQPTFRVAKNHRAFQIPADISHPLDVNFDDKIKLLGYHLPSRRVEPGDGLPITLYWQGTEWIGEEFVIFTRLLDNRQVAWGGYDRLARENYSALLWAPGEIIADGFAVPVAADAPPGVYSLSLGWYAQADPAATSLPIVEPDTGQPTGLTSVTIGPLKVGGPPPGVTVAEVEPQNPVKVSLGDQIELLGFDSKLHNQNIELSFYWQALRQPEADYSVFVHARNQAGETVTQKDQLLTGGVYPSSLWDAGEIIKDDLSVPLTGVAPGQYQVVVGLYDFASGRRLPVANTPDGAVTLMTISVPSTE